MASVFLSYDHEDSRRAAPIAAALEAHGHSVWWDQNIHGGAEYNSEIEDAVERSDAVVVLWSERSVRSAWVRDEAAEGRDAGKLVPVLIERVKPPMGFRQFQTLDLASWSGGKRITQLPELLNAIDRVSATASAAQPSRPGPPKTRARPTARPSISRRALVGGGAAAAAVLAGGIWWSTKPRRDPRVQAMLDKAEQAIRHQSAGEQTIRDLQRAVRIEPNNARALGLLALVQALAQSQGEPGNAPAIVEDAEATAQRALSIDPKESNALLAIFELQGSTLDWITRDQKLRDIVAADSKNVTAIAELVLLTQATGMTRESWDWNERALALEPLSADYLGKRALKLWILGQTSRADNVSDQVLGLYPTDEWAWWVRFIIYVFTGRPQAAQAMLAGNPTMNGHPPLARLWRESLPAFEQPTPALLARAREACIAGARLSTPIAAQSLQIMSGLRDVDTAFAIAEGALLSRGPIVASSQAGSGTAAENAAWRISTQWMWTPATAVMRSDRRFLPLCEAIGLADYWRKRGVKPDYLRRQA